MIHPDGNVTEDSVLSVHRSHNEEENNYLYEVTSKFIDTHPVVRNGVSWDGVGKMIGIGKHKDYVNGHFDFVQ